MQTRDGNMRCSPEGRERGSAGGFPRSSRAGEEEIHNVLPLLAPGGKADLTLVSGPEAVGTEDECREGVEVFVRPPGKSLDRVDSLSGGERSLAGLALALAVFQEGESPLFVLDEVEPALDDSNIRRV